MHAPEWKWRARRAERRASARRTETAAAALGHVRLAMPAWTESFVFRLAALVKRDAVLLPDAARIAAGREAENLRGLRADVADALARQSFEPFDIDTLALQQIALHPAAVGVLAHAARGGNNAVTGDDERHAVSRDDIRDCAHRARISDLLGDPGVAAHFTLRNPAHRLHHAALEIGSVAEVDRRLLHSFALQRSDHLLAQRLRNPGLFQCATVTLRVPRAQIVGRAGADHADRPIRERDPDVLHFVEEVRAAQRLANRTRRRDRQRLDGIGELLDIIGRLLAALADSQMLFDFAMFFGWKLPGPKRIDARQCWSTPHTRPPSSPAPPAAV